MYELSQGLSEFLLLFGIVELGDNGRKEAEDNYKGVGETRKQSYGAGEEVFTVKGLL